MKLWIGTSGFQYPAWKGGFYPEQISAAKMLPYYAERFSSTEINYTFRRIPSAQAISNWAAATPEDFRFSFKAPQRITHFSKLQDCAELLGVFHQALGPMGDKTGLVLFQLPPSFQQDLPRLESFISSFPAGFRAAFEFRHPSWFEEEVYLALRRANVALCIAEDEKLSTPAIATASFGSLRLRREDYTKPQINKWADYLHSQAQQWTEAFVYFKHEDTGVGPKFAQQLIEEWAARAA